MSVLADEAEKLHPSALPPAGRCVRHFDHIEVAQAGEAELIDKIVASMARVNRGACDKHRRATRDAHAKSGVLAGTPSVRRGVSTRTTCCPLIRVIASPNTARAASTQVPP